MSQLVQTTDLDHDLREIFQLVDRDGGGTSKKTNVSPSSPSFSYAKNGSFLFFSQKTFFLTSLLPLPPPLLSQSTWTS